MKTVKPKNKANSQAGQEQPRIGIFWYYKTRLLIYSELAADVKEVGGFKDVEMGHYGYWPTVQKLDAHLIGMEYEEVPRGRVVYDVSDDVFKVISSGKVIRGALFRRKVVAEFHLHGKRVVFETDEHYEDPSKINWNN